MAFIHLLHVLVCVQGQNLSSSTWICKFGYWLEESQGTDCHWELFRLTCHSHTCIKNDLMNNFVPWLHSSIFNKMSIQSKLSILQHFVLILYWNFGLFNVLTHHLTKLTETIGSVMNTLSFISYSLCYANFYRSEICLTALLPVNAVLI